MKTLFLALFGKQKGFCGLFRRCDYGEVQDHEEFQNLGWYMDKKPIQRKRIYHTQVCKNCGNEIMW